jgi:hypothetical protein
LSKQSKSNQREEFWLQLLQCRIYVENLFEQTLSKGPQGISQSIYNTVIKSRKTNFAINILRELKLNWIFSSQAENKYYSTKPAFFHFQLLFKQKHLKEI